MAHEHGVVAVDILYRTVIAPVSSATFHRCGMALGRVCPLVADSQPMPLWLSYSALHIQKQP